MSQSHCQHALLSLLIIAASTMGAQAADECCREGRDCDGPCCRVLPNLPKLPKPKVGTAQLTVRVPPGFRVEKMVIKDKDKGIAIVDETYSPKRSGPFVFTQVLKTSGVQSCCSKHQCCRKQQSLQTNHLEVCLKAVRNDQTFCGKRDSWIAVGKAKTLWFRPGDLKVQDLPSPPVPSLPEQNARRIEALQGQVDQLESAIAEFTSDLPQDLANRIQQLESDLRGDQQQLQQRIDGLSTALDEIKQEQAAGGIQRVQSGLQVLYDFTDGAETIHDRVDRDPLHLKIQEEKGWDRSQAGVLHVQEPLRALSAEASKLIQAATASNELTIEAWIKPTDRQQGAPPPARIVTLSHNDSERNFTLGQHGDAYEFSLRTSNTNAGGESVSSGAGTVELAPTHVVCTFKGGLATVYVNGQVRSQRDIGGVLSDWNAGYGLTLSNERSGGRPWLGKFYLVAIYSRALTAGEVIQNYAAGVAK